MMKMFYFTDAMCSWCYGFSPVIKKLKEHYPDIDLQIIAGGYLPGNTEVITDEFEAFLEYHWKNVSQRSGQYFDFSKKFITEDFRYDTEPSSRALAVVQQLLPGQDFEFLTLMQQSFYAQGKDITNDKVLAGLAGEMGIDEDLFLENFHLEAMKRKANQGFQFGRQLGVQGFPALLTLDEGHFKTVSRGFQPFESLKVVVDDLFSKMAVPETNGGHACTDNSCGY